MLLKTDEYDVLLVHPNKTKYNYNKSGVVASLVSENASGRMFTLEYSAANKDLIDWMHPTKIKQYRESK